MARITVHSIIGIPELTAWVSVYLTTSDIAHAVATCKAWSEQFQPFLWVNLRIGRMLPGRTMLEHNVHRIRNIDLDLQLIRFDGTFGTKLFDLWATLSHGLPVSSTACSSGTVTDRDSQQATAARVAVCTNLRRLKAVLYRSLTEPQNFFWIHLAPLLHNNSNTLTHLQLAFNGTPPPPMMQAISILYRLQHLTLRGPMQKTSWFLSLLRACLPLPRLSEFYCYFAIESGGYTFEADPEDDFEDGYEDEDDVEAAKGITEPRGELKAILEEAIASRTSENGTMDIKIRALKLPGLMEGSIIRVINGIIEFQDMAFTFYNPMEGDITSVILPILRSELVEIETLEVPELVYFRSEKFYEAMARKYCPGLRHLILPPYHCNDHPATVCSFIRGATGLKTVRGHSCSDGHHSLKSSKIMSTLATHHFSTLEELELLGFDIITRTEQQAILASCKNLRRFWVTSRVRYNQELGIRYQDIVDREWACLGMQELSLSLDRTIYSKATIAARKKGLQASRARELLEESEREELDEQENDLDQLGDEEQQHQMNSLAAKLVYTQIGRLSVLETLALGIERRFNSAVGDDLDRSVDDNLDLSVGDDLDLSGGDDLDLSGGDDLDLSGGDDLDLSGGDDLDLSVGDDDLSVGDDLDLSVGDDLDWSVGDDLDWSVGEDLDWSVGREWDLTLSKGWLAELSGLKKLRHLHMRTNFWSRMGQAEVEFMDAEWPLLGDISFDMEKRKFPKLMKQPHWKWLHQKRPGLCLRALRL